jgi:hypothetical protein
VTPSATKNGVFPFENVTSFRVVELSRRGVPTYQDEIGAVMFGVALDALRRFRVPGDVGCVESASGENSSGEILVALHTAKFTLTGAHTMARGALCWPTDGSMCFGDRSWRYLRVAGLGDT